MTRNVDAVNAAARPVAGPVVSCGSIWAAVGTASARSGLRWLA